MEMFNRILYKYSSMDNSSQILIFLIILVFLMLISIIIINVITKNKMLAKKNTTKNAVEHKRENTIIKSDMNLDNKNQEEDIEIIDDDKNNEVVEVSVKKTSIDEISKMIENTLENKPINLTEFEEDQEENAIISYDELVKRAGAKKIIYKCEDDKPQNIDKTDNNISCTNEKNKFRASKIISPVFGIQKDRENNDESIDSFIELEKVKEDKNEDIEVLSDIEFLGSLKKFRNELK